MPRRRMTTGYGIGTLRRRLEEIEGEVLLMDQDGRLPRGDGIKIAAELRCVVAMVNEIKARDYRSSESRPS